MINPDFSSKSRRHGSQTRKSLLQPFIFITAIITLLNFLTGFNFLNFLDTEIFTNKTQK